MIIIYRIESLIFLILAIGYFFDGDKIQTSLMLLTSLACGGFAEILTKLNK